jgi:hypothetical protein
MDHLPTRLQTEKINLKTDRVTEEDFYCEGIDDKDEKKNLYDIGEFSDTMIQIGDGGCSYSDCIYLGDGHQFGSIWYSNGDMYSKTFNSFEDLLKDKVNNDNV